MSRSSKPILLIEDSTEDREAVLRAFREVGVTNAVYHCESADDALDFLLLRGRFQKAADAPRPGLILLDLNLPGMDGRELLTEIKSQPQTRAIPVVIVTTSSSSRDVEWCYLSGANAYIQKPVDYDRFLVAIRWLIKYWFELVILPDGESVLRLNHGASDGADC